MAGTYTYDPGMVAEFGKDRMRFELGDTMTEGGADTTALSDEEISAALTAYPNNWKRSKLMLLETLYRRFSYEVDTKTGPLAFSSMTERAKIWKQEYESLKKEIKAKAISVPKLGNAEQRPPYFYKGMMRNDGRMD